MRLLFVADGRSPIAQNWIRYFADGKAELHLASTFPCSPDLRLDGFEITPVAFSGSTNKGNGPQARSASAIRLRAAIRHWLGPLTIPGAARRLYELIERVKPDLVHALRIPYEGMLAADAYAAVPLIVSVWGNDFTLHATSNGLMSHYTSWTMQVADAVHADCQRDIRLARNWGLTPGKPTLVSPGNGGVHLDIFYPPEAPVEEPVVVNPRGFRAYVRNDVFFKAIPLVLAKRPWTKFLCVAMKGQDLALKWVRELGIEKSVELLPSVTYTEMADIFRRAQAMVSPGIHDGTPNTLLESMASGCFPIAGDLESIREWITPGQNGLLTDASDPRQMADAILEALANKNLRHEAAGLNQRMIAERAEYSGCMAAAMRFYQKTISTYGGRDGTRT